jgi:TetR/AcrR family transcriptional repressor of nem operon
MGCGADTREKLLDTAIELIWRSSYDGVGVNEICKQAGTTKGGFYHHFESKADLFYEASSHYWKSMQQELNTIFSPSYTPLEQLDNLIKLIIDKQSRDKVDDNPVAGCPFFTSGSQCNVGEEKVRQASEEMAGNAVIYNVALVRGLKGDGVLNGDPEPETVGRLLQHFIQGLLIYGRVHKDLEVVKRDLHEGLWRMLDLKQEYRRLTL